MEDKQSLASSAGKKETRPKKMGPERKLRNFGAAAIFAANTLLGGIKQSEARPINPSSPDMPGKPVETLQNQEIPLHLDAIEVADLNVGGQPKQFGIEGEDIINDPLFGPVRKDISNALILVFGYIRESTNEDIKGITNVTAVVSGKRKEENGEITVTPTAPTETQKSVPVLISAPKYGFLVKDSKVFFYDNNQMVDAIGLGRIPDNLYVFLNPDGSLVAADLKVGTQYAKGSLTKDGIKWTKVANPDAAGGSVEKTAWEKVGVSKDIYLSYLNYALQQLPDKIQARMQLTQEDSNAIAFDFKRDGFVDQRGRVWRPNLTEDPNDIEAGWVAEMDSYYSKENNTYIILEGNPDTLGARKTGTKFKDLDFTDDFKSKIDEWISKYGTKIKGQVVHLTFVDSYSKKSGTALATETLGMGKTALEALQSSHFGYHKFIHIYAFGAVEAGGTKFTDETMFSSAICDALILAHSGFEGISPASAVFEQSNYKESANFLAPGVGSRPFKNTTSPIVKITS